MKKTLVVLTTLCSLICASLSADDFTDSVIPPAMSPREIGPSQVLPGQTNLVNDGEYEFLVFVPENWKAPSSGEVEVTVHFHGAEWFAVQEHLRRGLKTPLIAFNGGEGSGKYQRPFRDTSRLGRWLKLVEEKLKAQGAPASTRITNVSISSYSAGYAAIREILQSEEYRKMIKRVVIAGSVYADYAKDASGALTKTPVDSQIDPYIPFAQAAAKGEKTFVITFCEVLPGPYAGTSECADAIATKLNGTFKAVELDSSLAANDPDFPLLKQCDIKNVHLWGYAGTTPESHVTHARHLADIWKVLDEAKKP